MSNFNGNTMTVSSEFSRLRNCMVDEQIIQAGIKDPLVIQAMRIVPRENFVQENLRELAYENTPLPIGAGQTISQPFIVALMIEALKLTGSEKVLEIGAGCGYAAAVLSQIGSRIYTVERIVELAQMAVENLETSGCDNVAVLTRDGTQGYPEEAPFDAIVVSASGPRVPETLKEQLKIGGRLVIPVGSGNDDQQLIRITREAEHKFTHQRLEVVRFVPLIGAEGWRLNS